MHALSLLQPCYTVVKQVSLINKIFDLFFFILHLSNFERQLPQTPDIIHETRLLSVLNTCTLNLKTYKNAIHRILTIFIGLLLH